MKIVRSKVVLLTVLALAAGALAPREGAPTEVRPVFALTPHGQILEFDDGATFGTFGPNQGVGIALGQMARIDDCEASELVEGDPLDPTDDRPEYSPTDDFLFPFTNVYIVPTKNPGGDRELTDVTGTPAVAVGLSGGLFADTISYTGPEGKLGKGKYAVIYDECQDNLLDENDAIFSPAFEVVIPADVQNLDGSAVRKAKAQAKILAIRFLIIKMSAEYWKTMSEMREDIECVSGGLTGCITSMITSGIEDKLKEEIGAALGIPTLPDPAEIAYNVVKALFGHYANLGSDPPNLDHERPAALGRVERLAPRANDPLEGAVVGLGNTASVEAALTASLLDAIELYQGAQAERDGDSALIHAREIAARAGTLADTLGRTDASLTALRSALGANAGDLEAIASEIDPFRARVTANGFTDAESRSMRNAGLSSAAVEAVRLQIAALPPSVGPVSATQGAIDDVLEAHAAAVPDLRALAATMAPVIANLLHDDGTDDLMPRADAGGPYAGTRGAPRTLDASGSSSPKDAIVSFAWDLDGDGEFDDASGRTPSFTPSRAFTGFVGLKVTDDVDRSTVGYAPITISDTGGAPSSTSRTPAVSAQTLALGTSRAFSVSTSDPDGDLVTVRWFADLALAHTGATFTYTPPAAGQHVLEAHISDGVHELVTSWRVTADAPEADGDLWRANVDCDDANAARFPGNPDVANGIDDDCDDATPDGGTPPVVDAGADHTASEGRFALAGASFTDTGPSTAYEARIEWGDGTSSPASIRSGRTVVGEHDYTQDGTRLVRVCVTGPTHATGCDTTTVTVANVPAAPRLPQLDGWIDQTLIERTTPAPWTISEDTQSVMVTANVPGQILLNPSLSGYGTGKVTIEQIADNGDGDQLGLVFGYLPNEQDDPSAEFYIADWSGPDVVDLGTCGITITQRPGVALSRVTGRGFDQVEFFGHDDTPCSPGHIEELTKGLAHPTQPWERHRPYVWEFDYQPDRLRVWIDGVLEIDRAGTYPPGRFGLYNSSISETRYSDIEPLTTQITAQEGASNVITMAFDDPGTDDALFGTFTFGDGTEGGGEIERTTKTGVLRVQHTFADEGTTTLRACATDGAPAACLDTDIVIENVAPTVHAGPDLRVNALAELAPASFTDPGVNDTHTATIDWGDGTPAQPVVPDDGVVRGDHTYLADGTYTARVCVTDDAGATGCDAFEVTAAVSPRPASVTVQPVAGSEGTVVSLPVAWSDDNPVGAHTVRIDWGDGSSPETFAPRNEVRGKGVAFGEHTYGDDGAYTVTVSVCEAPASCVQASTVATIANVAPVAADDTAMAIEDEVTRIDVLANDTDVPADDLSIEILGNTSSQFGDVVVDGNEIVFTPAPNDENGRSVTYRVRDGDGGEDIAGLRISIQRVNDPPRAVDDVGTTTEDTAVVLSPMNNDRDVDSNIRVTGVRQPRDATVTLVNTQQIRYVPDPDRCGVAEPFTYTVQDFEGLTGEATVRVTVTCVNDAPVVNDETVTTDRYASVDGDALANDADVESPVLSISLVQAPAGGTVDLRPDGTFTFTPDPKRFTDGDRFVYRACDADGACDFASTFVHEVTCEEGLEVADGSLADGTASRVIAEEGERRVAGVSPGAARVVRDANCGVVVPLEQRLNQVRIP